ncbi:MAG: NAD+ synthase [Gammaproteobacteria bacterium]|nr:NAD+ synthase [Gammaproteobacteria bacterium]
MKVAIAQCNPLMGDIAGNTDLILRNALAANEAGADVVIFPELALCGYPPEDLLFRPAFRNQIEAAIQVLLEASAESFGQLCLVFGAPHYESGDIYNAAVVIQAGKQLGRYFKQCLPNYGVFDEQRYFAAGDQPLVLDINGTSVGVTVCEDIWHAAPCQQAKEAGAELLLNLNASPFHEAKLAERMAVVKKRVTDTQLPMVYCNLVGGQDELVFDGRSMAFNASGECAYLAPACAECVEVIEFEKTESGLVAPVSDAADVEVNELAEVYDAIVLAVRDYVTKNNFPGVVLGLSGGIDSALVLAVAVDALGADKVEAVLMPSRYTADMSNEDAAQQAKVQGVHWHSIAIEPAVNTFEGMLAERFAGTDLDTTEENIQARIRGLLLMAISNKTGKMVLTTSNKSETAIGYATLYGDMAGGYGPLKDVFKTLVYQLARYKNESAGQEIIPNRVIERPPSAELRPDQKDTDSLPPYEVLDPILEFSIEADQSVHSICELGYDEALVRRVVGMIKRNEYKRQQASPGVKITRRAFGRDRRYPITSGYQPSPK